MGERGGASRVRFQDNSAAAEAKAQLSKAGLKTSLYSFYDGNDLHWGGRKKREKVRVEESRPGSFVSCDLIKAKRKRAVTRVEK